MLVVHVCALRGATTLKLRKATASPRRLRRASLDMWGSFTKRLLFASRLPSTAQRSPHFQHEAARTSPPPDRTRIVSKRGSPAPGEEGSRQKMRSALARSLFERTREAGQSKEPHSCCLVN